MAFDITPGKHTGGILPFAYRMLHFMTRTLKGRAEGRRRGRFFPGQKRKTVKKGSPGEDSRRTAAERSKLPKEVRQNLIFLFILFFFLTPRVKYIEYIKMPVIEIPSRAEMEVQGLGGVGCS